MKKSQIQTLWLAVPAVILLAWTGAWAQTNTKYGTGALHSNTSDDNSAFGYDALYNNTGNYDGGTGTYNTAIGAEALYYNTTGSSDTAAGSFALYYNTTGGNNTANGAWALEFNNSGTHNTASGAGALNSNTTGSYNDASGAYALLDNLTGDSNTASGYYALIHGNSCCNVADGYQALLEVTSGQANTGVGHNAGATADSSDITGNNNTFLGTGTTLSTGSLTNASAIGANAEVAESNALVLGSINGVNGQTVTVKVGIGTTTPTNVFTIANGAGDAIAEGWSTYSSRRWKTNIQTLPDALAKVEQLRGVSYDLKNSGKHEIGVIAEEVGAVLPEVVSYEENGTDARGVDYSRLTALLIEATKEQQALIAKQQAQIAQLTSQVKAIRASLKTNGQTGSEAHRVKTQAPLVRD